MNGIVSATESHHLFDHPVQLAALQEHLSYAEIETICRQLGHKWRDRDLPPGVMVRSLVYRSLNADKSINATLADLAAAGPGDALDVTDPAWCQARSPQQERRRDAARSGRHASGPQPNVGRDPPSRPTERDPR